jgi:hypothetical protein
LLDPLQWSLYDGPDYVPDVAMHAKDAEGEMKEEVLL